MKFFGAIGYGFEEEVEPGKWRKRIEERNYAGEIQTNRTSKETGADINDDINISNVISIIADQYAYQNFQSIQYVTWYGSDWKVRSIEPSYPRLILTLGGVYNGPKPEPATKHS